MQYELLKLLKCPVTKTELRFELISEFKKSYSGGNITEIKEGLLFSSTGFVFPIINGIPRMLLESIYDHADFLSKHLSNYQQVKENLQKKNKELLGQSVKNNRKTKHGFAFEWSFLDAGKKDKIWHDEVSTLSTVFLQETGESIGYFKDKNIIDIGSGHGRMTTKIAEISKLAIGVELSPAVENAYTFNQHPGARFVQDDLQFLPFADHSFEVLYSSGVIHHTRNPELSFSLTEKRC